jgi:hypothetical protein
LLPVKGLEGAKFGCVRRFFTLSREDRMAVFFSDNARAPLPTLLSDKSERKEYGMPKRKTPGPPPIDPSPQQEFMTVAEVAALLRWDPRSVLNRIKDGDLDAVKDRRRWLILVASYYRYRSNLRNRRR